MSRFGFVGGTYGSRLVNATCQRCVNFYPEQVQVDDKSSLILLPTPGLSEFATVANAQQVRGEWTINGRTFVVIDQQLCELLSTGQLNVISSSIANDGNRVSFTASPQQLVLAAAGQLYVYFLQSETVNGVLIQAGKFVAVAGSTFPGPVSRVGYIDGFFLALIASSQQYWVSNPLDATTWTQNGGKIISVFSDNVVSMGIDHRELWLFGAKESDVEYDSGNIFPFDTVPGGYIEQGCGAADATVNLDNGLFWIGARNDQGWAVAWRTNGYAGVRVSNHAVESSWSTYPMISDARAFSFVMDGHSFWQINFPSANRSWRYDVAMQMWHEVSYYNVTTGREQMHLAQCATFNFGKILVGDRSSGTIYQMAPPVAVAGGWNFVTDNGNTIRRMRRAPHVSTEQEWIRHFSLQVDFEMGLGPMPPLLDGAGNPRGPIATLSWSDDGGHTWSNGHMRDLGQGGQYKSRAIWRRLGRSRDRVYQIECADPVPIRIVDAYLKAAPGFEPQERITKQYAKVS